MNNEFLLKYDRTIAFKPHRINFIEGYPNEGKTKVLLDEVIEFLGVSKLTKCFFISCEMTAHNVFKRHPELASLNNNFICSFMSSFSYDDVKAVVSQYVSDGLTHSVILCFDGYAKSAEFFNTMNDLLMAFDNMTIIATIQRSANGDSFMDGPGQVPYTFGTLLKLHERDSTKITAPKSSDGISNSTETIANAVFDQIKRASEGCPSVEPVAIGSPVERIRKIDSEIARLVAERNTYRVNAADYLASLVGKFVKFADSDSTFYVNNFTENKAIASAFVVDCTEVTPGDKHIYAISDATALTISEVKL